jgi:hypothetical protein
MGGLKKLMEVVNNFIGSMSHPELVVFFSGPTGHDCNRVQIDRLASAQRSRL